MSSFSYQWIDEGGVRILYSRPLGQVDETGWAEHYENMFSEYGRAHAFFIVDLLGIADDFSMDGIKKDIELLVKYGFKSARYALLTNDSQDYLMVKLFNEVARLNGIDAEVSMFTRFEYAKKWLLGQAEHCQTQTELGGE